MKALLNTFWIAFTACILLSSCINNSTVENHQTNTETMKNWKELLNEQMPLLGHRNWIVITDMAYPLQSANGITTIYADEPFADVLKTVKESIDKMPHVFAHIYHDREFDVITEAIAPGIDSLRADVNRICGKEAKAMMHEDLIKRLDEASRLYNILIIKTPLCIPYTTQFLELDCGYWDADRQAKLDALIK